MLTESKNDFQKEVDDTSDALREIAQMQARLLELSSDDTISKSVKKRLLKARRALSPHSVTLAANLHNFGVDKDQISKIVFTANEDKKV